MLKVGLTGGIGSGKSTAAAYFRERGAPVLDADEIARELVAPGRPALDEIVETFGPDLLRPDGRLDRHRLRRRVFDDPEQRRRLEAILHPRVRAELERRLAALDARYCVLVVPLLLEAGYRDLVDRVLVIDAPPELQRERAQARDGLPRTQVEAIAAAQAERAERLAAADEVIRNDGDLEKLRAQVAALDERYRRLSGERS
ncbi:MAG: dephospho-CoA kinase [Gammaproteobacteria bacterium]|nr:dephospho-CoA kinase [Gammaproteobacteria bacterium]